MSDHNSNALGTVAHLNERLDELHDAAHAMHDAAAGRVGDDYGRQLGVTGEEDE